MNEARIKTDIKASVEASNEVRDKTTTQLLATHEYSDLIIRCGTREWHVHKGIVCPRSKRITAEVKPCWQKDTPKDEVGMNEEDPEIVDQLITYLYTSCYRGSRMLFHTKMYILADQYGIDELKTLSFNYFASMFDEDFNEAHVSELTEFVEAVRLFWVQSDPVDHQNSLHELMGRQAFRYLHQFLYIEGFEYLMGQGFEQGMFSRCVLLQGRAESDRNLRCKKIWDASGVESPLVYQALR